MLSAPREGPSPVRRTMPMVRDVRLFVNTLQHAVDLMTQKASRPPQPAAGGTAALNTPSASRLTRRMKPSPSSRRRCPPAPAPQRALHPQPACVAAAEGEGEGDADSISAGFNGAPPCFGAATAPVSARWPHEKPGSDSSRWKAPPLGNHIKPASVSASSCLARSSRSAVR